MNRTRTGGLPIRRGADAAITTASLAAAFVLVSAAVAQSAEPAAKRHTLSTQVKPWKGDFDEMLKRHQIRVLIPYSRTLYYSDKGRERGVTADLVREFERYVNRKHAKELGKRPLTVYIIPTTRDKLLTELNAGRGDIAAGNLTVTEERLKVVDFAAPNDGKPVQELVVAGPKAPPLAAVDDLSGNTVYVRPTSSYYESMVALNARLEKAGRKPAQLVRLPDELEDEDVLEMLNAGLFDLAVVDDWKAQMWAQVLPKIKVRDDLVLRAEGHTGWAVRKGSPKLVEAVLDFYRNVVKKQGGLEVWIAQHRKRVKQITNNTANEEWRRFEATIKFFERYGQKYGFDPLMLVAQGYQESQLQQSARSHVGAIGVMQLMPDTGKSMNVGDINQMEPNIHAGVKYMDQLMSRYFPDANFSEAVRPLFAFASYNAGPGNISRMRKEAAKQGLDPDKWFNNVELVVAQKIGIETTTYVRNIYKYYAAYKLTLEAQEAARKARQEFERKP